MVDMNQVWAGTRTYMMSGRTNPPPAKYIATLKSLGLSVSDRTWLFGQVMSWPGGNQTIVMRTVNDIKTAYP